MFSPDSSEFRKFWTEDRIDRSFAVNSHRLIIGIDVAEDWSQICGSLVVAQGRGKFLQLRHASDLSMPVPDELKSRLKSVTEGTEYSIASTLQLSQDLADCQAQVVNRLSGEAGKYVDRILAVTVMDPGFWAADFDGASMYTGACDPARLAELTGLNVIDELPRRDLAAGGKGQALDALPLWFLFADRQTRGATGSCIVYRFGDKPRWYLLPESDGLDEIQPAIESAEVPVSEADDQSICRHLSGIIVESSRLGAGQEISCLPVHELVLINCGHPSSRSLELISGNLKKLHPNIVVRVADSCPEDSQGNRNEDCLLPGRLAALLGLLYIDQVPQNVPGITGALGLRILGRLTPGKPFSFRNLLTVMADSQSSPMRLRDAI